jgi:hypothetical protein
MLLYEILSFVFGLVALAAISILIAMVIKGGEAKKNRRAAMENIASSMATYLGATGPGDTKAICIADKIDDAANTTEQKIANLGGACMVASLMSKKDSTYNVPSVCSDYSTLTEDKIESIIKTCGVSFPAGTVTPRSTIPASTVTPRSSKAPKK